MQTADFTMVSSHMYSAKKGWAHSEDHDGPPEDMLEAAGCNICTASVEKRIKMEHAWQLWAKFLDSFSRYQDWLQGAEAIITFSKSSLVLYTDAKEELKKFEVLRRQVRERLGQLESLNRQYRRLTQLNGIGLQARLRAMVQECNQRWDSLHKQATAIHKRLKYFVSLREEFEGEREVIELRLTELDLKLTDVEHLYGGNTLEKIEQLQPLQQDVQLNVDRVVGLLVYGEQLIQRSEPLDAESLEEELQDLSCYCQEVFRRVFRFRDRLVSMRLVFEDEWQSDKETDQESDCFSDISLEDGGEEKEQGHGVFLDTDSRGSHQPPPIQDRVRHRTASSKGGSLDLEWDPSVDVGGSTSHDEDDSFHSAVTGIFPFDEPQQRRRCSYQISTSSSARSRPRTGTNSELNDLLGSTKSSNGIVDSRTVPNGDLKVLQCSSGLSEGKEQPPGVAHHKPTMNGSCCQADRPAFDPERIETWLVQTHPEMRLEAPQTWEARSWSHSTKAQWSVPTNCGAEANGIYCSQQTGTVHHQQQPKSTSRLRQKPVMKERPPCSQDVIINIEKRKNHLLPPAFSETPPPLKKKSLLVWLKTLVLASFLLGLCLVAGIFLLYVLDSTCSQPNHKPWSRYFRLQYVNGPPPT